MSVLGGKADSEIRPRPALRRLQAIYDRRLVANGYVFDLVRRIVPRSYETTHIHHAFGRCSGGMAADSAGAAGGKMAYHWLPGSANAVLHGFLDRCFRAAAA